MSARAVLNTVYALLARKADAADERQSLFGKSDDPLEETARHKLDDALGLIESPIADEGDGHTNVVQLRAWVEHVNRTMV